MVKKVEIFQIKITLKGSKPPIWRRVLVRANMNFHELQLVIQAAMGWENYHLYQFDTKQNLELVADNEDLMNDVFGFRTERKLAKRVKLSDVFVEEKQKITYWYDFGDDWMHDVTLEKIIEVEKGVKYPTCTAGKRACPPEDCGGVWGYENLLDLQKKPPKKGSDEYEWYEEQKECLEELDSEEFDLEEAKEMVQNYKEMEVELGEISKGEDFSLLSTGEILDANNKVVDYLPTSLNKKNFEENFENSVFAKMIQEAINETLHFTDEEKLDTIEMLKAFKIVIGIYKKMGIDTKLLESIAKDHQDDFSKKEWKKISKDIDVFVKETLEKYHTK